MPPCSIHRFLDRQKSIASATQPPAPNSRTTTSRTNATAVPDCQGAAAGTAPCERAHESLRSSGRLRLWRSAVQRSPGDVKEGHHRSEAVLHCQRGPQGAAWSAVRGLILLFADISLALLDFSPRRRFQADDSAITKPRCLAYIQHRGRGRSKTVSTALPPGTGAG